jgi:hypothetical protein
MLSQVLTMTRIPLQVRVARTTIFERFRFMRVQCNSHFIRLKYARCLPPRLSGQ